MPGIFDEEINKYLTGKGADPDVVAVSSVNELLNGVASQRRQVGVVQDTRDASEYIQKRTKARMAEARHQGFLDLRR